MSGSGSNAEKLLEYRNSKNCSWECPVIFTDRPNKCRASEIADKFKTDYLHLDIKEFYRSRGLESISLRSSEGQKVREEWTSEIRKMLRLYDIDFAVLAGFIPLTNITNDFPCLNVHPGDLTVLDENGKRVLVGLHTLPIETAILNGLNSLRTSVILAQTYTGAGGEMDSGPILGISPEVKINLNGYTFNELKKIAEARPSKRPRGGFKDKLEETAKINQENLKINGDWIVFPPAVDDFASGKSSIDDSGTINYEDSEKGEIEVLTVEYGKNYSRAIPL